VLIGAHEHQVTCIDRPCVGRRDVERLFDLLRRLKTQGHAIVYISHFIEEVKTVSDRFVVLRDGRNAGAGVTPTTPATDIVGLMVGRAFGEMYPRGIRTPGDPVLQLNGVVPGAATLALRRGEILGIAGLIGTGRTETLRACFGLDRIERGRILVYSRESTRGSPARRLAEGVGLLSENRKEEGLLLNRTLADNLTITRYAPVSRLGIVSGRRQRQCAREWMERLDIRAQGPNQEVTELSGGNQQKVAVARLLHHDAGIFLLDEPTRGIDVGSKVQIYKLLGELAAQGKAIIFVSSYLPELLGVCDTIGVMCRGVLSAVRPAAQWNEHTLMAAAIGQAGAVARPVVFRHAFKVRFGLSAQRWHGPDADVVAAGAALPNPKGDQRAIGREPQSAD